MRQIFVSKQKKKDVRGKRNSWPKRVVQPHLLPSCVHTVTRDLRPSLGYIVTSGLITVPVLIGAMAPFPHSHAHIVELHLELSLC